METEMKSIIKKKTLKNKLESKRAFLYEDSKGIVAICGQKVIREYSFMADYWYEKYKQINVNNTDKKTVKKIIKKVLAHADFICSESYVNDKNIVVPNPNFNNYINIKKYINELTEKEVESLMNQVSKFEKLYKKCLC